MIGEIVVFYVIGIVVGIAYGIRILIAIVNAMRVAVPAVVRFFQRNSSKRKRE